MTRREWLAVSSLACMAGCGKPAASRSYPASREEHGNPERGFYVQRAAEDPGDLSNLRSRGISLVLLTLNLQHYRNRPLDDAKLSVLDAAMRQIRKAGLKVIFRAAYGFTAADYRVDPQDLALIGRHITVMARVLTTHAPWVFAVQAGMLGPWGEWHGSVHGNPPSLESRLAVVRTWLEHLPDHVFLQVRRPRFLRDMAVDPHRVGWHNDALLAMPDDMGTYDAPGWDRSRELRWCEASLPAVPFGGETVPASEATAPAQVLDELQRLHATFLNRGYHQGTLAKWQRAPIQDSNLQDLIQRRLGYRLAALRLELEGARGRLILRNEGFAAPLNPRRVAFAWYDPIARKVLGDPVAEIRDLRAWLPEAGEIALSLGLPPRPASAGCVPAVRFADHSEALADDGRHAIRLVGQGLRFDEATGWNLLG